MVFSIYLNFADLIDAVFTLISLLCKEKTANLFDLLFLKCDIV
ncbi:hypothetical protein GCWU000342_00584 [Shuttleworthella satelles DSM 14600]|uniref:Uncharacterized protein n=1 Tax=Shuttleworthella satelles DSM 14600 TaxID=626523 RepID=C4G9D1_9FIRM|nr:hypothetical protein GCWU000342_00584 [Shuttleworthia satelles DSM 14600]